jgi:hypothetical protein
MKRRGVSLQPREEAPAKRLRRDILTDDPLKAWILDHLAPDLPEEDVDERCNALVEVGQLLIAECDRYPSAKEMREEVEELVTQLICAEAVEEYINLCLFLRSPLPHPQHGNMGHPQASPGFPMFPGPRMPFPMFDSMTGMPLFHPPFPDSSMPHGNVANLVFSKTGEPTAVQKLKEREAKRKELLQELTEQLKTLVAKASEQPVNSAQRQKYLVLIDGIKKRISNLSSTTSVATVPSKVQAREAATAEAKTGGLVGYYSNAYVNPEILKKEEQRKIDEFNARVAKAKAAKNVNSSTQ